MLQHRADRRLGHVQHARGRRHRAGLHDGMEDLHLAEVHHRSFIVLASNIRLTYSMASAIDWTPRAPAEILRGKKAILGERSEEHTSELQSLMRISYAVFCLKKKKQHLDNNKQYI